MTYCPLHNVRHGLPHGQICPDHSCQCMFTVENGEGVRLSSRCPLHGERPVLDLERPFETTLDEAERRGY